jgi:hypothetical protein
VYFYILRYVGSGKLFMVSFAMIREIVDYTQTYRGISEQTISDPVDFRLENEELLSITEA